MVMIITMIKMMMMMMMMMTIKIPKATRINKEKYIKMNKIDLIN